MKRIQSKLHRIGTYDFCKIYLSCFDDKRYILDHGINSLAYFQKDMRSQLGLNFNSFILFILFVSNSFNSGLVLILISNHHFPLSFIFFLLFLFLLFFL